MIDHPFTTIGSGIAWWGCRAPPPVPPPKTSGGNGHGLHRMANAPGGSHVVAGVVEAGWPPFPRDAAEASATFGRQRLIPGEKVADFFRDFFRSFITAARCSRRRSGAGCRSPAHTSVSMPGVGHGHRVFYRPEPILWFPYYWVIYFRPSRSYSGTSGSQRLRRRSSPAHLLGTRAPRSRFPTVRP